MSNYWTTLPAAFPPEFRNLLPLELEIAFQLTESTGVNAAMYEHFDVGGIEGAIAKLVKHSETFVIYRLLSRTVRPTWAYTVDWPLRRRGRQDGTTVRRGSMRGERVLVRQGPLLGTPSSMRFELRNQPVPPYANSASRLMLKTGGESPGDAVSRWNALAHALRRELRDLKNITVL